MSEMRLSSTTRKALSVQIGEQAGREIAELLSTLARRVEELERTKVNVMAIAPQKSENLINAIAPQRVE